MADFRWTEATEEAAQLVAAGNLSITEVADRLNVTRQTIWNWRRNDEFKARVDAHLTEIRDEIRRIGIADQLKRVAYLNDRVTRMRRVIESRADDPTMANVPGGTTGLLVRTTKALGSGEAMTVVDEYAVDTGLLKEMREHEKQAAQELGQWAEKREISGKDGGPLVVMKLGESASMDDL